MIGLVNKAGATITPELVDAEAVAYKDNTTTATAVGTITGTGNAEVIITSGLITGSPITLAVAVVNGDTPTVWAGKVRTAIAAEAAVMEHYSVGGSGAEIILSPKNPEVEDATLNIALDNDTCTGITPAASSTTTGSFVARGVKHQPTRGGKLYVNSTGSKTIKCRLAGQPLGTITSLVITAPCFAPTNDLAARIAEVYETGTTPAVSEMLMMY